MRGGSSSSGVVIGIVVLDIVLIAIVAFVMHQAHRLGGHHRIDRFLMSHAERWGPHARDEASASTIERA